jgi:hypothetical protein
VVTITGSGIADGNFLIWGNDDGALTFSSTEVPTSGKRLTREWKVAETGDIGSVTLSFDLTSVAGANFSDATKFRLLTDADGNFSDATPTTGATINGNSVEFSGINLSDGQYFSLAYNNPPIAGFGTALDFDGTNDSVIVANDLNLRPTNTITVETWVKYNSLTQYTGPFTHLQDNATNESGYGITYLNSQIRFWLVTENMGAGDHNDNPGTTINTDTWYHIAGTYDGTTIKFYLNGVLSASEAKTGNIDWDFPPTDFRIGAYHDDETHYFDGSVDEVRVWNVARTQAEIQANMYSPLAGSESGLVGYWPFEEGSGTTASDLTANGNNGTLTNMDNSDWVNGIIGNPTFTTNENSPLTDTLSAYDADGDSLTYSIVSDDGGAAVLDNASTGAFTYTPHTTGTHTFTYKINDGIDDSNTATVTVTVMSLVVSSTADTKDGNYTVGQNTLREAIANASAGDTITFDSSIAGQTITLTNQLDIAKNLTIDGTGQKITISGGGTVRVFNVTANTITFNNLTIANGNWTSGDGLGGGIKFTGTLLTIEGSNIVGNTASMGATLCTERFKYLIFKDFKIGG